ncbi:elafin [Physeter macrocephalus]|uniref:Elafin n=1 Tax=Physeter macrocephalus TaxID=9755 RepID=A0A2Y9F5F3_PHYMC|nr:elafin [Physeter catodon]|eukprot:XP_007115532.1 elafin [Physeter catodon]
MKSRNFLIPVVVLLVLGTLVAQAALVRGQGTMKGNVLTKGQYPVKVPSLPKHGSCPRILIRCAAINPPNKCLRDADCPEAKKCCVSFCGKDCLNPL